MSQILKGQNMHATRINTRNELSTNYHKFKKISEMKISNFCNFEFFVSWILRNPRQIFQIWDNPKVINNLSQNHKKFAHTTPSIKKVTTISRFHELACEIQVGPLKVSRPVLSRIWSSSDKKVIFSWPKNGPKSERFPT